MNLTTMQAFADEYIQIKEARGEGFGGFTGGGMGAKTPSISTAPRAAPSSVNAPPMPRAGAFSPAVVGAPDRKPAAKPAPPMGALNPGGGML